MPDRRRKENKDLPKEPTEEEIFASFQEKHGNVVDLARIQGKERAYEEELRPVFDSVLGMVQIVTGGDPEKTKDLIKQPGLFFEKLIEDEEGLLRGFLMARAMHEVVSRPSKRDPLEWGKFMLDIMAMSKGRSVLIPEAVEGKIVRESKRTTSEVVDELLQRVDRPREEPSS